MIQEFQYLKSLSATNDLPVLDTKLLLPATIPAGEHAPRILML